ncbi:MAG TPA: hypothetical protein VMX14_06540 [Anaerolineae bacterium]|nr:hypothetical protein [Anaerolineae bacterium]
MFKELLSFRGVNWWTLLGGMGLNFIITLFISLAGVYFATEGAMSEAYQQYGALLMTLAIFIVCGLAGFVIAKIADDVPVKHSFLSSLGAFVPLVVMAVLTLSPYTLMLGAVALAGGLNGGMLAVRRHHYHYRPPDADG